MAAGPIITVHSRRRIGRLGRLACLTAIALAATPGAFAQEQSTPAVEGEAAGEQRELTVSELHRAIDEVRRNIEEQLERAKDRALTEDEQRELRGLQSQLDDLLARLKTAEAAAEENARARGGSVVARWSRTRLAVEDLTRYDIKDGMFRIKIGIRFQLDGTLGEESAALEATAGAIDSSVKLRRGRVFARGRLFRTLDFRFEYDFGADDGFKDVYLEGARFTRYVKWRIGHFKEPFSLSRHTGNNYLGFLEWPLPVQVFAPGRNWGLMLRHTEAQQRLFWAVSVTTAGETTDDSRSGADFTLTGRITGLPMYRDEGRRLVHLGLSYSARDPRDDTQRFAARPEARFTPLFVDTGDLSADKGKLLALEGGTVQGPLWVQAEWLTAWSDTNDQGSLRFDGAYIEAGWFLTGESRFYRTEDAAFGRLTPSRRFHGGNPFTGKGDGGAIEVTARVSAVDLNDRAVQGGEMTDLSLGLNWYPTATTRLMLNYIHSDVQHVGSADILLLRYQFNP